MKEINLKKLPLTFKFITEYRNKNCNKNGEVYYVECKKYQTNFYVREKPVKPLVRML